MKKTDRGEGLGLLSVVWIGFNFVAGITFAAAFSTLVWGDKINFGLNLLWIDAIEGTLAFICAWSFSRLVRVYPSANGGISQFSRGALGKFWGLVGGLLTYMSLPLLLSTMIVSTLRTNCETLLTNALNSNNMNGNWADMILDLAGFLVFLLTLGIMFLGTKRYKYFSNIIGILTWVLTLIIIIFGIGAFVINGSSSITYLAHHTPLSNIGGKDFATTFLAIFFSFAGLETFITSGQTIRDRGKNVPIAMVLVMIFVTLFYIIFTVILMGACIINSSSGFGDNPSITLFNTWDQKYDTTAFKSFGTTLIIAATLLIRFNSIVNMTLIGGTAIEPLARQGFVSPTIAKQNKRSGLPLRAIIITSGVYVIAIVLFLIIPDFIKGITGNDSPFTYAILGAVSSIVIIGIYALAIISCIVLGIRKKMKVAIIEYIGFFLVLAFMGFLIVMYFWTNIIDNLMATTNVLQSIISAIVQLIYIVSIVCLAFGLYYGTHRKIMKKMENDKEAQASLLEYEKVFEVISFVKPEINKIKTEKIRR